MKKEFAMPQRNPRISHKTPAFSAATGRKLSGTKVVATIFSTSIEKPVRRKRFCKSQLGLNAQPQPDNAGKKVCGEKKPPNYNLPGRADKERVTYVRRQRRAGQDCQPWAMRAWQCPPHHSGAKRAVRVFVGGLKGLSCHVAHQAGHHSASDPRRPPKEIPSHERDTCPKCH